VGYYDGTPFQTNTACTNITMLSPGANDSHWGCVGCYTHGGTPSFTDDEGAGGYEFNALGYPNNGWTLGALADIRIYSVALDSASITNLHNGVATGSGGSSPSNGDAPAVPQNLAATPLFRAIQLNWDGPVANADGYLITSVYTLNGSQIIATTNIAGSMNSWTNVGLLSGTNYCYEIDATNSFGDSGNSRFGCATPLLEYHGNMRGRITLRNGAKIR
jgi:hypothetical protein